jgi:hypothetical protein
MQTLELAKTVLGEFLSYGARYWPLVMVLVMLHLAYALWTAPGKNTEAFRDSSPAVVLEHFFRRGYEVERVIFQGRGAAEYILTRLGRRTMVHVKWWNQAIDDKPVLALHLAQKQFSCQFGIIISKEGATRAARQAAILRGVSLWDYVSLEDELEHLPSGIAEAYNDAAPASQG